MKEIDSKRMTKIISIGGAVAMLSFLYMIICFFRLDWIRYDLVQRSWQVESMLCENQAPLSVIRFYKKPDTDADIPIRFSKPMLEHLNQQQQTSVEVKRKLVGYLREWDYGIILPLTIAGKRVSDRTLIPRQLYVDCEFEINNKLTQKVTETRRKMR